MRRSGIFEGRGNSEPVASYRWEAQPDGLHFKPVSVAADTSPTAISTPLTSPEIPALLDQLVTEDLATAEGDAVVMDWEQVHELVRSPVYASSLPLLQLPPPVALVPRLQSRGALTDAHFAIGISGWVGRDRAPVAIQGLAGSAFRMGDSLGLLSAPVWRLLDALATFGDRPANERTPALARRHWGRIRRLAVEAGAVLDDFLVRSVVVTPEKLDIQFRKTDVGGTHVVEITPTFAGAPERWLEHFDRAPSVPDHLDIPTEAGAVHVALSEPVRSVLREIKRLPGRRAAGARAEAFLLNPLAALGGDDAASVIDPEQFAKAQQSAGIAFDRFRPLVVRNALGYPVEVRLEIDTAVGETERRSFNTDEELTAFVSRLAQRLERGLQLLAWEEFEFELDGDAAAHLAALKSALEERSRPQIVVRHEDIFDLSSYSDRIVGIGAAEPFLSAYIVKDPDKEGWFNANLLALRFRPEGASEDVTLPVTADAVPEVKRAIDEAKTAGTSTLSLPGCPAPLPVDEVEAAVTAFEKARTTPAAPAAEPANQASNPDQPLSPRTRQTLVIKGNIDKVDHHETREKRLPGDSGRMERPRALRASVELRPHQVVGVARMQHLFKASPEHCRGVLLADDMGLGKTLQLLMFIAWAHETHPDLPPALIVAPVSLLENWQEEIARFFEPCSLRVLTAYDEALASLRVPRASIDADLQREGLVRFLKPDWRGDAQIVLTTYETLRDLEFSFAKEPWSILVCDEAQKIKNPNALVTKAVKKLNVRFRVACTGTPVENGLTDLWCLFDMVQPGLLGALNTFGREYGRVIESGADSDTVRERLASLRTLIDAQVIRRTKKDVAKDLPAKIFAPGCRLDMSNEQRALYVGATQRFHVTYGDDEQARMHHLSLLRHLHLVCTDP
ncbi:MAG TPA: SNF2-related protein, partial [Hyphomicrobiaceae bacterium]|nr:SNF2-related protein [Hyphomicrobiaceae bacterium]